MTEGLWKGFPACATKLQGMRGTDTTTKFVGEVGGTSRVTVAYASIASRSASTYTTGRSVMALTGHH